MAAKLGRIVAYHEGLPPHNVTWSFNHVVLWSHVTNYFSTCTRLMYTKHGKVGTYFKGFHIYLLITCSHEVIWQIKIIKLPISRYLWSPFAVDLWEAPTHNVTWFYLGHVTNGKVRSSLSQDVPPLNLAGRWLHRECSEHNRLSLHQLLVE